MKYNFPKLPFFLSIILLLFSCFSFSFLYTKIEDNNTISIQMLKEWQTENQIKNNRENLDRLIKSIDQGTTLLNTHFIQSSDVVPFLNMIEKLAPRVGANAEVTLVDISGDNKELTVQVKASGSFEAIYKFVMLLENSPYELEFISLDMQGLPVDNATSNKKIGIPQWSATLGIKLLSFIK